MQIAVIQFPGATSDIHSITLALARANMTALPWRVQDASLPDAAGYIIVAGGYHDQPRPGILAALHPVIASLRQQSALGKPILGLGTGAHVLVEAGFVPGIENDKVSVGLVAANINSAMLTLTPDYQRNAFTRHLTATDGLAIAPTCDGFRFSMSAVLQAEIMAQGLAVFCYADNTHIAGLANKAGNVLALLPTVEVE